MKISSLRNLCIIAHVDHGKTTLVDFLLRQAGTFASHENVDERVMDSSDQEKERGITISAKNASFFLPERIENQGEKIKVNLVDTPGHADFSAEIERIMNMVDAAVLLVDASEGPKPQTRFVLKQAIQNGLKILVCLNKIDRPEIVQDPSKINQTVDKIFDLFVELEANSEQLDFPILYACAKDGWCVASPPETPEDFTTMQQSANLDPMFEAIAKLPSPHLEENAREDGFSTLVSHTTYSDFLGTLAMGRVFSGTIQTGDPLILHALKDGQPIQKKGKVAKILHFQGLETVPVDKLQAGDIGFISGFEGVEIGDSLCSEGKEPLERVSVDPPSLKMIFQVNRSPFSGKEGKAIQARELKERLVLETKRNVALRLEDSAETDAFYLFGRGELQFSIVIENLRREGLEFMVGSPTVETKTEDGVRLEPLERFEIEMDESFSGDVTEFLQKRKGEMVEYQTIGTDEGSSRVILQFLIPSRGLLGTHSLLKTLTKGTGIFQGSHEGYVEDKGEIITRQNGALVSDRAGKITAYALESLQARGQLFVPPGTEAYPKMIIGENSREGDMHVNPTKTKKLTNVRSVNSDGIVQLQGIRKMSLEEALEWIKSDEFIEVTPKSMRLLKV